ncbi:DsbA family protein [Pseudoruegeria sp. SK021]|uniref:DsbA family protein n=1 Tax=Pseudoruegeria sp. SK021 TaxID=1933035 RepID=UPI000A238EC6|nr:DsbA family protein [Pseudoruegeria sp. SK021]OSP56402.1 hypothetical protein BV911_00045 [Pseudoruegeria sp. SK021]
MTDPHPPKRNRRGVLALAAGAAFIVGLPQIWSRLKPAPRAQPHPTLPGFLVLDAGPISGGFDPFAGLIDPNADRILARQPQDVCTALFQTPLRPGAVPVAFFTDINCPYCREMENWLAGLSPDQVAVTWHDLPLLGPSSLAGARAIGAAKRQGAEAALRARLHRTRFQPDAAYLTALADGLGLDAPQMLADLTAPTVETRIAESLGLADAFGIAGTPALVVGRTLAVGNRTQQAFDSLVSDAWADRANWPCPG